MARNRSGRNAFFQPRPDGMGYRSSLQEAVHLIQDGGVHVRRRAGMGAYDQGWEQFQFHWRRGSSRLYVLASAQAKARLVPGAQLWIRLLERAPAIDEPCRRPAYRDSIEPSSRRPAATRGML